jgi:hypothetical protein
VKFTINIFKGMFGWMRNLHREAALDSLRNVLAVVGGATILADFSTIKIWLIAPMLAVAFLIWFLDYERHFRGQTVDESWMSALRPRLQILDAGLLPLSLRSSYALHNSATMVSRRSVASPSTRFKIIRYTVNDNPAITSNTIVAIQKFPR